MISNATPLISLARINELTLLQKMFEKIVITGAVKTEILVEGKPGFFALKELEKTFLHVKEPKKLLPLDLGSGENAAISLAYETKDTLLIDDAVAIQRAHELGIETLRTTTVIFLAVQKGLLHKGKALDMLNLLIENGYYITTAQYAKLLEKLKK
ncbi:hypothetical protein J4207_01120 [Candidatus Woesearchaeota archaeon]|nr:hypothetical protein [Candidatus Woesearchaeota archaeon]